MNKIQQEYVERTGLRRNSINPYQKYSDDYTEWLEKELEASRESRQLSAVPSEADELLKTLIEEIERWNESIEKIIGRQPKTWITLDKAKDYLTKRGIAG